MLRQDRYLLGMLVVIGLIVAAALGLFFTQTPRSYVPEDSPEDIVHNYAMALSLEDYQKAYTYLAEAEGKPDFSKFRSTFSGFGELGNVGLQILEAESLDDQVLVDLVVIHGNTGLFDSGWREDSFASLVPDGPSWKIVQMPYPYWGFDWYQNDPALQKSP